MSSRFTGRYGKLVLGLTLVYLPKKKAKAESTEVPPSTEEQEKPSAEPAAPPSAENPSASSNVEDVPVASAGEQPEPLSPNAEEKVEEASAPSVSEIQTVEDSASQEEAKPAVSGQHK